MAEALKINKTTIGGVDTEFGSHELGSWQPTHWVWDSGSLSPLTGHTYAMTTGTGTQSISGAGISYTIGPDGMWNVVNQPSRLIDAPSMFPISINAKITRVVDDDLVYVITDSRSPYVFTPDKIEGYGGQPLKKIGVHVGTVVRVIVDVNGRAKLSLPKQR